MMSRKDYIASARVFADAVEGIHESDDASRASVAQVARGMADVFAADNCRFDRQRFYFACALEDDGR